MKHEHVDMFLKISDSESYVEVFFREGSDSELNKVSSSNDVDFRGDGCGVSGIPCCEDSVRV